MEKNHTIVGIGEILWDFYPGYRKLGGAPANFAYFAAKMGHRGLIISRIGEDGLGREALELLSQNGIESDFIQMDKKYPTGTVEVLLDSKGKPTYVINEDVAWDFLLLDDKMTGLLPHVDAVCFGSLAQRSPVSRGTIENFLESLKKDALKIFDVNLRQDFYSMELLSSSLRLSDVLKMNSEEMIVLQEFTGIDMAMSEADICKKLIKVFDLRLVCLTKGEEGSLIVDCEGGISEHKGPKVKVRDTVGSGDSYSAAIAAGLIKGLSLEDMNEYANSIAAWTASKDGAMPSIDEDFKNIIKSFL